MQEFTDSSERSLPNKTFRNNNANRKRNIFGRVSKTTGKCIVPCCRYVQPAIWTTGLSRRRSLFRFPKDKARVKLWVNRIDGLKETSVGKNTKICDAHFHSKYILKKTKSPRLSLSKEAMPCFNIKFHKKHPIVTEIKQELMDTTLSTCVKLELKLSPPAPRLKKFAIETGIKLMWDMSLTDEHEKIKCCQVFASREDMPNSTRFKKIGEVQAVSLPMSCDLNGQNLMEGKNYRFVIRAVDWLNRLGQLSNVC